MEPSEISQSQLKYILSNDKKYYVGISRCVPCRNKEHRDTDQLTIIYFARTENMKLAENKLLELNPEYNAKRRSNAQEEPGCVYLAK